MPTFCLAALLASALFAEQTVTKSGAPARPKVRSHIAILDIDGKTPPRTIHEADRLVEAPNWSPDGAYLLVNSEGRLWKLPVVGGPLEPVATGAVNRINNDHGISPDGKWFVISAGHMYLVPSTGGEPKQITSATPSYYHGWSPDGATLAYCARRDNNFDIYGISREGGPERRLTSHIGYDDGPDYTPDGRWIYFNSDRSGSWDIWRMPATGAGAGDALAERVTSDEFEDWFPHPSPDGKWIVFVSFEKGTQGHPANRNVVLRRMPLAGGSIEIIAKLFGGQGTLNVNSWSPDSRRFAFVRYSLLE